MATALGLDLGIKTGSLAQIRVDEKTNAIDGYRVLCSWTKGPKVKDSLDSITEFFDRYLLPWLNPEIVGQDQSMAIDWNRREIYWSANKAHSNTKTFLAGYMMCHCHSNDIIPIFIDPKDVRRFFGFSNQKTPKEEVQRHFLTKIPRIINGDKPMQLGYDKRTEHDLDALILAYIQELKCRAVTCPVDYQVKSLW